jgi:pyruvate kinase
MKLKVLAQGETVVVVQGWKGGMGNTNTWAHLTLEMF